MTPALTRAGFHVESLKWFRLMASPCCVVTSRRWVRGWRCLASARVCGGRGSSHGRVTGTGANSSACCRMASATLGGRGTSRTFFPLGRAKHGLAATSRTCRRMWTTPSAKSMSSSSLSAGRFEDQWSVGAAVRAGHSTSSHRTGRTPSRQPCSAEARALGRAVDAVAGRADPQGREVRTHRVAGALSPGDLGEGAASRIGGVSGPGRRGLKRPAAVGALAGGRLGDRGHGEGVPQRPQRCLVKTRGWLTGKTRGGIAESQSLPWGARSFPEVDSWLMPTERQS